MLGNLKYAYVFKYDYINVEHGVLIAKA